MEPDVIPIRSGWLTALVSETMVSSPGQDFWLKGSNQKCHPFYGEIATRRDWHINGNAIYKLNDRDFEAYLDSVQAYYTGGMEGCPPGCGTGRVYENAYDHALFQFRQEVENFNQSRNLLHKFHYTPIIANLCEEMYNTTDLAEKNPELYLVHSKGPDLSGDYHEIQDAIHKILRRHGSVEVSEYHGMLRSGMEMPHIMYMICERETKPSHFCFKICLDLFTESEFPMRCAKYKEFYYWANRFDDRVYVWSVDFHGAPASCNSEIYEEAGAEFHAEIDFSNCEFHKNCKDRLKILSFDSWRGFGLDPCPNRLRHDFYQHYKDDPEMARVDAIVCSHPAANCELFMPLNKSLIIYATTRIEFGRFDELVAWRQKDIDAQSRYRWEEWARNIVRISKRPGNIIAANNIYDVFYIKYMTGIDAMYLPSWCSPKASWTPRNERDILLGPSRDNLGKPMTTEAAAWQHPLLRSLREANARKGNKFSFTRFGELQDRGKVDIESIAGYRCIVLIPYQASFMSFFEYYRMNIPLFAPSKQLFYDWERKYNISWERVYGLPSPIVGFDHVQKGNPNSFGENASKHWLDLFDIYNFPHVQYFDSWGELLDKLEQTNFVAVSKAMEAYNVNEKGNLIQSWRRIFQNIRKNRIPNAQDLTGTFEDALESLYGTRFIGRDYRAGCSHSEP
ncbi:hypothetical protein M9434_002530 [Picochlorum sp. BPE23]|nr:hypothetical protein M9434_002530 [Picochlorum sp. BPE23]